jgi:poly-gamma-glutamate system protein
VKLPILAARDRFTLRASVMLLILALAMALFWYRGASSPLDGEERALWEKVRSAQTFLHALREGRGAAGGDGADPEKTGFIGVEWSPLTTTLGPLEAKRTAADPLWSVYSLRQLKAAGVGEEDRVAIISSSSFPGLVYSVLAAAELRGASILWIHSLGSSTWGANDPSLPWPGMASALRQGGFLAKKADRYTLGGRAEMGLDLPEEGREILTGSAAAEGISLLEAPSLGGIIDAKWEMISGFAPRLLINIGGGAAAFAGNHSDFLRGGLFSPERGVPPGDGLIQRALASGVPVLHFLDMRGMGRRAGVPWDGRPSPRFASQGGAVIPAAGPAFFFIFLLFFKRWDRWNP